MRCCGRTIGWDYFQRRLSALCGRYSAFVAIHPYPFILIPILISCVLSVGWIYKKDAPDVIYMYTPTHSRSKLEQADLLQAFPIRDGLFVPGRGILMTKECQVTVVAKDGASILREKYMEATARLNEYILKNIIITYHNQNYSYMDLCLTARSGCYTNPQILLMSQMRNGNAYVNMSYPMATYDGQHYYLASTLGGVTLDPNSHQIIDAKAWLMVYQLKTGSVKDNETATRWERQFEHQMLHEYKDQLITFTIAHSGTLDREVARNGEQLAPRFVLMLSILILFALFCTFTFIWRPSKFNAIRLPWRIDWSLSRPYVALAGVIGAGMGVASAIGLLSFIGLPYAPLVKVVPFLIIAVRLDNTFLMIGALEMTKRSLPAQERIGHAMAEAAVSITITVLTDILSFLCGVFTNFPSVQIFSTHITVAIFITFIYQLTFLLGILVLSARAEEKKLHNLLPCVKVGPVEEAGSQSLCSQLFCIGTVPSSDPPYEEKYSKKYNTVFPVSNYGNLKLSNSPNPPLRKSTLPSDSSYHEEECNQSFLHRWIKNVYSPWLLKRKTKIGVLIFLLIFWGTSAYGCSQVRTGLEPVKLLLDTSYAVAHYRTMERYFWEYGIQMQLAFLTPGDISQVNVRKDIMQIVSEFANTPHSVGMDGVDFWLIAFEQYLQRKEGRNLESLTRDEFYDKLDYFLSFTEYSNYLADLSPSRQIMENSNITFSGSSNSPINSFRLLIGLKDFSTARQQQDAVDQFRKLADSYPQFKLVVYNLMWSFVDQYEDIMPNVMQEIYSSVAFMVAIALFLIPHPACALWVALAIGSIDLGVIGYMTFWGLNMDTVTMVTIILSIGFSVDFTAHIAYAYVVNIHEAPDDRVKEALGALAWPVLQGGISTLIGVVVLADLDSYMLASFFKTVFLVIIFGLLHALVFLPVLLSISTTPNIFPFFPCRKTSNFNSIEDSTENDTNKITSKSIVYPMKEFIRLINARICKKNEKIEMKSRKTPMADINDSKINFEFAYSLDNKTMSNDIFRRRSWSVGTMDENISKLERRTYSKSVDGL